MNEVLVNKDYGSFRLPLEIRLWLLKEKEVYELFRVKSLESSSFAKNVVLNKIEEDGIDFADKVDERWAYFNWSVVDLQNECFCGLDPEIKVGIKRSHPVLLDAVRKFEPDNYKIVEIDEDLDYHIEQTGQGEKIIERHRNSRGKYKLS